MEYLPDPTRQSPHVTAWQLFQHQGGAPAGESTVDRLARFVRWAVAQKRPGFAVGEPLGVAVLAESTSTSRVSAGKALDRLSRTGLIRQEREQQPYRILSDTPLPEKLQSLDDTFSITLSVPHVSALGATRRCDPGDASDPHAALLRNALARNPDETIAAARDEFVQGPLTIFRRARLFGDEAPLHPGLMELTFLRLPNEKATQDLVAKIEFLRGVGQAEVSLLRLLSEVTVPTVPGRTLLQVDEVPELVVRELKEVAPDAIPLEGEFRRRARMVRWDYALFAPLPCPLLSYSICYVDTRTLHVFIRNMEVDVAEGG